MSPRLAGNGLGAAFGTSLILAAALIAIATLAPAAPKAGAAAKPPSRLGVRGAEYDLVLSRPKLRPGAAVIQFQNVGEDPHDLNLKRVGGSGVLKSTGELGPGEVEAINVRRLKPRARYRLWCSLPDHRSWGMEAHFRVKRRG